MAVSNVNITKSSATIGLSERIMSRGATALSKESTRSEGYNIGLRKDVRDFEEIQAIKARLNEIAEGMRESSGDKKDILEQLKANLNGINKFFPPYPPGSEERVKLLKGYVAFRLLIEKLTIPPEVIDMRDDEASEKSVSIKNNIEGHGKGISVKSDNMQQLF